MCEFNVALSFIDLLSMHVAANVDMIKYKLIDGLFKSYTGLEPLVLMSIYVLFSLIMCLDILSNS